MRNSIQNYSDYKYELARLRKLEEEQELRLKLALHELQDSMQPAKIVKEAFNSITENFSGLSTVASGIKLGINLLGGKKQTSKEVNPLVKWIAGILLSNIVKATEGEKRFDLQLFIKGITDDLKNDEGEEDED